MEYLDTGTRVFSSCRHPARGSYIQYATSAQCAIIIFFTFLKILLNIIKYTNFTKKSLAPRPIYHLKPYSYQTPINALDFCDEIYTLAHAKKLINYADGSGPYACA